MRKAFGAKVFVKGKHVKVALSRFAIELVLNETTVFFFDAHVYIEDKYLEQHFQKFGQIFRCHHLCNPNGMNKSYGFVDFLDMNGVSAAVAERTQLVHPGQYVKVRFMT